MQCPANTFGQFLYVQLPGSDRILHLMDVLTVMGDTEKTPCHSCIGDFGFEYSVKFKAVEAS